MKIRSKILLPIYTCTLLWFSLIGTSIYYVVYQNNLQNGFAHLETRTTLASSQVYNLLGEVSEKLLEMSLLKENIKSVLQLSKYQLQWENQMYKENYSILKENVSHFQTIYPEIQNIIFTDKYGIVLYSLDTNFQDTGFIESFYGKWFLQRAKQEVFISDIRLKDTSNSSSSYIFASVPMYEESKNNFLGNVILEINTHHLDIILSTSKELWKTGQTYLVGRDGIIRTVTSQESLWKFQTSIQNSPTFLWCFKNDMSYVQDQKYTNFSGEEVIGRYKYIEIIDMCLITEITVSEIAETSNKVLLLLILSSVVVFLTISLLIHRFIKKITSPLLYLNQKIQEVGKGNTNPKLEITTQDEVGDLTKSFGQMLTELAKTEKKIQKKVHEQTLEIRKKKDEAEKLNIDLLRFQEALKKASDYIAIFDKNCKIVYMNKSLEQETGYTLTECIWGKSEMFWRKGECPKRFKATWKKLQKTKQALTIEMITSRKNGTNFISDVHISPILDGAWEIVFYLTIETDITQENKVKQMKEEFISLVSHELRTPMTVIWGFTKLFLEEKFWTITPEQRKYLERIDNNTTYLIDMVNDMLDIEKLNSGKIEYHYENFDMYELARSIQEELEIMCQEKDISLSLSGASNILMSDKEKLQEVLLNLVRNAYKFTDSWGRIIIKVSSFRKNSVKVEIQDTGIGIKKEDSWKIFQKFWQVDSQLQRSHTGTGLGLSICKLIVENLWWKIGFVSEFWKGSTFYFTIPKDK